MNERTNERKKAQFLTLDITITFIQKDLFPQ